MPAPRRRLGELPVAEQRERCEKLLAQLLRNPLLDARAKRCADAGGVAYGATILASFSSRSLDRVRARNHTRSATEASRWSRSAPAPAGQPAARAFRRLEARKRDLAGAFAVSHSPRAAPSRLAALVRDAALVVRAPPQGLARAIDAAHAARARGARRARARRRRRALRAARALAARCGARAARWRRSRALRKVRRHVDGMLEPRDAPARGAQAARAARAPRRARARAPRAGVGARRGNAPREPRHGLRARRAPHRAPAPAHAAAHAGVVGALLTRRRFLQLVGAARAAQRSGARARRARARSSSRARGARAGCRRPRAAWRAAAKRARAASTRWSPTRRALRRARGAEALDLARAAAAAAAEDGAPAAAEGGGKDGARSHRPSGASLLDVDVGRDADDVYPTGWASSVLALAGPLGAKGRRVAQLAVGSTHTAALTDAGELYSWGWNDHGQLGHGSRARALPAPRVVEALLHADPHHGAAAATANRGGLSAGGGQASAHALAGAKLAGAPQMARLKLRRVCAGADFTRALADGGRLFAWGDNRAAGSASARPPPARRASDAAAADALRRHATAIVCGAHHAAAIGEARALYTCARARCSARATPPTSRAAARAQAREQAVLAARVRLAAHGRRHARARRLRVGRERARRARRRRPRPPGATRPRVAASTRRPRAARGGGGATALGGAASPIGADPAAAALACRGRHTLLVAKGGGVLAARAHGQLGLGDLDDRVAPAPVAFAPLAPPPASRSSGRAGGRASR